MGVKNYSLKKDGETAVAKNFKVKEFCCKDGSDTILISEELVALLQTIRDHFGVSVHINSAYRTEAHNAKVGGVPNSQHKLGLAADIVVKGVSPLEVACYAETLQPERGGIGVYGSFTHVDVREKRARWDQRSGKTVAVAGWYAESEEEQAVQWAQEAGIIGKNESALPNAPLTVKQAAVLLYRYHQKI